MQTCSACGKEAADGLRFCPNCGAPLKAQTERIIGAAAQDAAECETPVPAAEGAPEDPTGTAEKTAAPAPEKSAQTEKKKPGKTIAAETRRKRRRAVVALGAAVLLLALFFGIRALFFTPKEAPILCLQDGELTVSDGKSADGAAAVSAVTRTAAFPEVRYAKDDPERFVFVNDSDLSSAAEYNGLTWADTANAKAPKTVSITSERVLDYGISDDGRRVFYVTAEGALYTSDLKQKQCIAENVGSWLPGADGKTCAYINTLGELWYKPALGKDAVRVANDVSSIELLRGRMLVYKLEKDGGTLVVYDVKKGTGTTVPGGEVRAPLADSDGFYVLSNTGTAVTDTKKDEDAKWAVTQGNTDEYGYPAGQWYYWYGFYTDQGKQSVEGKQSAMTLDEYNAYSAREAVRTLLGAALRTGTLQYCDGKTLITVAENVVSLSASPAGSQKDALLAVTVPAGASLDVEQLAEGFLGKVKAMEYTGGGEPELEVTWLGDDASAAEKTAAQTVGAAVNACLAYGSVRAGELTDLGVSGKEIAADLGSQKFDVFLAADGKTLGLLDRAGEGAKLYTKPASAGSVVTACGEDVAAAAVYSWGTVWTQKSDGDTVTLWLNGEKVDNAVKQGSIAASRSGAELYYVKAYNGVAGQLYRYSGGKAALLSEDVHDYQLVGLRKALALRGYISGTSQGELVLVKNGRKAVPLGAGVSDLLSPFDTEHYVLLGA